MAREPFLRFSGVPSVEDAPRLYCFAYAGGTSSVFASWARALSPRVTVLGVELPGHGSRFAEIPLESVTAMAETVAEAIADEQSDAPYAFYGHSLGAFVAFETGLRLQARAVELGIPSPLLHLFAGAARGPHLPALVPAISHLAQAEFLQAVQARYGGLPAVLFEEPELLEMVLPVLRADFRAYEGYRYTGSTQLPCPVTAFYGTSDAVVQSAAVGEWSQVTKGGFTLQGIEGDHFFLNGGREILFERIGPCFGESALMTANSETGSAFSRIG